MRKEAKRWLRQAEADLKAAKDSFKDEDLAPVDYIMIKRMQTNAYKRSLSFWILCKRRST